VAGLVGAHSTEFHADTPHPVIGLITEWLAMDGRVEQRGPRDLGGTMRLGGQLCRLEPGSLAARVYGRSKHHGASPPPLRVQQPPTRSAV
jgi:CTP synthase